MIHCFHCPEGEYQKLNTALRKKWVIANSVFSRNEWHVTAVYREFLNNLSEERREMLMTRLVYPEKKGATNGCTQRD